MAFPFTLLVKNALAKNVLRMIMIVLIVATGSRLGFYAVALILLFMMVFELKKREWSLLLPVLTIAFILTDGFYYFPTGMKKVKEVALISQSVFTDRFPEHCYLKKNSQESRNALFLTGKQLLLNKPIAGHGAGGFTHELEQMNTELDKGSDSMVTNAHNFILELLVDFGVLIVFPIALLFYRITQKLRRKKTSDLLLVFLLGIAMLAGTIMVSSLVYFLPFFLFLFLSFSVLSTDNGSLSLE
jgi:O-antigen ligase